MLSKVPRPSGKASQSGWQELSCQEVGKLDQLFPGYCIALTKVFGGLDLSSDIWNSKSKFQSCPASLMAKISIFLPFSTQREGRELGSGPGRPRAVHLIQRGQ